MLRQEGGPAQNVADHQGAVVLVLENGLHHVADDVAVPQVHSVFRHDDQGEVQPVGQLHQPPVHYGHKDPHVEENQPHLTGGGQPLDVGALGLHIQGNVGKAGDDDFTAEELVVAEEGILEPVGVGELQHRDGGDQLFQRAFACGQAGAPETGKLQEVCHCDAHGITCLDRVVAPSGGCYRISYSIIS